MTDGYPKIKSRKSQTFTFFSCPFTEALLPTVNDGLKHRGGLLMSVSNHGGAQLAEAVRHAYAAGQDDYHLEPMVLTERGVPVGRIRDHDAVVFCCRRGEREIELTELFTADDLPGRGAPEAEGSVLRYPDTVSRQVQASAHRLCAGTRGKTFGPGPLRGREKPSSTARSPRSSPM